MVPSTTAGPASGQAKPAPVYTHTWSPDHVGEQQIRILDQEGVDLDRVYIGHSNDTRDVDYILGLLQKESGWG